MNENINRLLYMLLSVFIFILAISNFISLSNTQRQLIYSYKEDHKIYKENSDKEYINKITGAELIRSIANKEENNLVTFIVKDRINNVIGIYNNNTDIRSLNMINLISEYKITYTITNKKITEIIYKEI